MSASKSSDFQLGIDPYLICGLIYGISMFVFEFLFAMLNIESLLISTTFKIIILVYILLSIPMLSIILGIFSGFSKNDIEGNHLGAFLEGVIGTFSLLIILAICFGITTLMYVEPTSGGIDSDDEGVDDATSSNEFFTFVYFSGLLSILAGCSSVFGNMIGVAYQKRLTIDKADTDEYSSSKDFVEIFNFINILLGKLPNKNIERFVNSNNYSIYENIGNAPEQASNEERVSFFLMINELIQELPPNERTKFFNSSNFQKFQLMSNEYKKIDEQIKKKEEERRRMKKKEEERRIKTKKRHNFF